MSPENNQLTKLWIVARVDNAIKSTKMHKTFEAAKAEAMRLARHERAPFYVFQLVGMVEEIVPTPPTKWVEAVDEQA